MVDVATGIKKTVLVTFVVAVNLSRMRHCLKCFPCVFVWIILITLIAVGKSTLKEDGTIPLNWVLSYMNREKELNSRHMGIHHSLLGCGCG